MEDVLDQGGRIQAGDRNTAGWVEFWVSDTG
jgi:hypothetical protein